MENKSIKERLKLLAQYVKSFDFTKEVKGWDPNFELYFNFDNDNDNNNKNKKLCQ